MTVTVNFNHHLDRQMFFLTEAANGTSGIHIIKDDLQVHALAKQRSHSMKFLRSDAHRVNHVLNTMGGELFGFF